MMRVNMSPPRPIDDRRVETLPAMKALILNRAKRPSG
jgi:hypothetical protein